MIFCKKYSLYQNKFDWKIFISFFSFWFYIFIYSRINKMKENWIKNNEVDLIKSFLDQKIPAVFLFSVFGSTVHASHVRDIRHLKYRNTRTVYSDHIRKISTGNLWKTYWNLEPFKNLLEVLTSSHFQNNVKETKTSEVLKKFPYSL